MDATDELPQTAIASPKASVLEFNLSSLIATSAILRSGRSQAGSRTTII
jgi:hypothetical protein